MGAVNQTIWIGIDPGLTGAVAWLGPNGVWIDDAPTTVVSGGSRRLSAVMACKLLDIYARQEVLDAVLGDAFAPIECRAVLECVAGQAFGRQGVVSAQRFAYDAGIWDGILASLEFPYQLVSPAAWKRKAPGGSLLGTDKAASRSRAMQLWPADSHLFRRQRDDGRAEALLMAAWLRSRDVKP